MTKNLNSTEKYLRIGLGVAAGIAALSLVKSRTLRGLLGTVAISALQSGLSGRCALKQLLSANAKKPDSLSGPNDSTYARTSFDHTARPSNSLAI